MNRFKIGLMLSYICIASVSAAIVTPALPQIEQAYSLSDGALEWVVSIFLLGYVIGQLIYGPVANQFGRLTALRIGLVINLIGIMICLGSVWFLHYGLLLFGRLITALGAAAGLSCTFMLINESLTKCQARQAMSYAIVSFSVGAGLAVTIGGIVTHYFRWEDCFIVLLIHGITMLALTWQFSETLKIKIPLHPLTIISGYRTVLKNRLFVINSLAVSLVASITYCYSASAPLYAQFSLKLTPDAYGYWNLLNTLGMLASGFVSAKLIRRIGPKRLMLIGLSCMLPCLASLILISFFQQTNTLLFFITTMFLFLFSGYCFPGASFFAHEAVEDKANASSMMSFINMGGAMTAVVLMGYLPLRSISAFTTTITVFFIVVSVLILSCIARGEMQYE